MIMQENQSSELCKEAVPKRESLWQMMQQWRGWQIMRTRDALLSLSDETLCDIGVCRADVIRDVRRVVRQREVELARYSDV